MGKLINSLYYVNTSELIAQYSIAKSLLLNFVSLNCKYSL